MLKSAYNHLKNIDSAIKVAVIYVFLGCLWIIFSDNIVEFFVDDLETLTQIQTIKGWFYVFLSGLIIYFLVKKSLFNLKRTQKTLDQALLFHKTLFEKFPQPVYQLSPEGKVIYLNSKCKNQPGLNKNHLFDNTWLKYVHPDDQHFVIEKYRKALLSEKPYSIESRLLQKDGTYKWFMDNGSPFFTATGQIRGYIGSSIDINEKKIFQSQLENALDMYSSLFDNNPTPMFVYDVKTLEILEVNDASVRSYGYSKEEFERLTLRDICYEDNLDLKNNLKGDIESVLNNCHRHITKDKSIIDVNIYAKILPNFKEREACIISVQNVTEKKNAYNELLESEKRFKTLFKSSPDIILILSGKLIVLDCNEAGLSFFGMNENIIKGMSLYELFDDSFADVFIDMIEEVNDFDFFQKTISSCLYRNSEFSAEIFGLSFFEKGEKRYYISLRDITEKVLISKALEESERMLNTLIDNLPGMVYRCGNDPHYKMEFVSAGCFSVTGYKSEQIQNNIEVSFGSLIHHEDRKRVWDEIQEKINKKSPFVLIYRIISSNNEVKWVVDQGRGVFNNNNDLLFIEGFISDITEEKNTQDALTYQSNLLKSIVNNIPFPLFYKNISGKYLGCNHAFSKYLGKNEDEIIGKTVFEIFSKEQAEVFATKDKQLYDSLTTQIYETTISFPNGNKMEALFFKSVFFDTENKPAGIIGVYLDITDRVKAEKTIKKQMAELERINTELESFTYTVSHDLRSPLVTIKGFLNLIRENAIEGNISQMDSDIKRISNATDKMHFLLEDLLQLSRIGRTSKKFEVFSPNKLISEVSAILKGIIDNNKAVISVQKDMPDIYGDRNRIAEVYQNLIENALKFKGNKKPYIKIGSYTDKNKQTVYFVEDNGIGVSENFRDKIFGLFNKLDQNSAGTGIGLSIVKRIIEFHDGKVWCESAGKNEGIRFLFTIGLKPSITK